MPPSLLWISECVVLAIYVCSLFLPAFRFASHAPVKGLEILLWGWWGVLMYNTGWLANPLVASTMVLLALNRFTRAAIVATAALLCACHSFAVKEYYFSEASGTPIKSFGAAFYVWLVSVALQFVVALVAYTWHR